MLFRVSAETLAKAQQVMIIDAFTQLRNGKPVHVGRHVRHQNIRDAKAEIEAREAARVLEMQRIKAEQDEMARQGAAELAEALQDATPEEQDWANRAISRANGRTEFILQHLKHARTARERRRAMREAYAAGVIEFAREFRVGDETRAHYAIVIPDASEPGRWRASHYDEHGFSGHETHDTPQQVLDQLSADGYTTPANGTIEKLSMTGDWKRGMARTRVVQMLGSPDGPTEAAILREVLSHMDRHGPEATAELVDRHLGKLRSKTIPLDFLKSEWARWNGGADLPVVALQALEGSCS